MIAAPRERCLAVGSVSFVFPTQRVPLTEQLAEDKTLKVRIFALAKELGMDSKVLIQHANDAGIPVKASALASISPAERDVVLEYLKSKPAKPAPEKKSITRDDVAIDSTAKARQIKAMPVRSMAPIVRPPRPAKELEPPVPAAAVPQPELPAEPIPAEPIPAVVVAELSQTEITAPDADAPPDTPVMTELLN